MRKLRKLRALRWNERAVLCRAGVLLVAAEVSLRLIPFRAVVEWVQGSRGPKSATGIPDPERIAGLVRIAARNLWLRPTCLRQSLVLCVLLRQQGLPARLAIGTTSPRQEFRAHAWVVLHGRVVGSKTATEYRELISIDPLSVSVEIT